MHENKTFNRREARPSSLLDLPLVASYFDTSMVRKFKIPLALITEMSTPNHIFLVTCQSPTLKSRCSYLPPFLRCFGIHSEVKSMWPDVVCEKLLICQNINLSRNMKYLYGPSATNFITYFVGGGMSKYWTTILLLWSEKYTAWPY